MSSRYTAYTRLKIDYPADRILRLTFDRPETYNSVDAQTHTQLTNIWRDINDDPDINAVIVTGAGKAFSAGGDFELIKSVLDDPIARMATWREAKDLVYNVINCVDLQKVALETAQELASGAQSAIRWTKYALNNWLRVNGPLFDTSTALEMLGFSGAEAREGLTSHLEKRRPSFPPHCPI
jgi:enoyl-CoA hydratase/carnithine racemase